eukprot:TRINITY_DN3791_c0_g1_i1.p1 TRINITY_DN3791_c0_g1~~TRINITY_DN3791_c0_g1_i1.p1  ORF type:complete len:131 (-),score=5.25 TRINITY_DN3791_c0_g1_i1:15-407(-)
MCTSLRANLPGTGPTEFEAGADATGSLKLGLPVEMKAVLGVDLVFDCRGLSVVLWDLPFRLDGDFFFFREDFRGCFFATCSVVLPGTGRLEEYKRPSLESVYFHHRCHRNLERKTASRKLHEMLSNTSSK